MSKSSMTQWALGSAFAMLVVGALVHGCQRASACEEAGNTWHRGACFKKGIIVP